MFENIGQKYKEKFTPNKETGVVVTHVATDAELRHVQPHAVEPSAFLSGILEIIENVQFAQTPGVQNNNYDKVTESEMNPLAVD